VPLPEFEYCTVKMLRDEGITTTELPDNRARSIIRLTSRMINRLTDQWFSPVKGDFKVDGRRVPMVHLDNLVPIIELDNVKLGGVAGEPIELVDPTEFVHVRDKRIVELVGERARFPRLPLGVILTGIFGWLEREKDVKTTLTAAAAIDAETVAVVSSAGFQVGDQVLFGFDVAMVSEVPDGVSLKFDKLEFAWPIGGEIRTLGRTPLEIRRACILLVNDMMETISAEEDSAHEEEIESRIVSESVEGYSYSLAAPTSEHKKGSEGGGGNPTSGNSIVDDILQGFVTPVLYMGYGW